MVRWLRWHCPPDTGFKIRALAVWGWARYLSVTEAPHNTDFNTWMGKKHFLFLSNRRDREPNPELVKGSGANHYPRAPAPFYMRQARYYYIIYMYSHVQWKKCTFIPTYLIISLTDLTIWRHQQPQIIKSSVPSYSLVNIVTKNQAGYLGFSQTSTTEHLSGFPSTMSPDKFIWWSWAKPGCFPSGFCRAQRLNCTYYIIDHEHKG